jgi:PAS domain-containing protein
VIGAWSDITARTQARRGPGAAQDRLVHLLSSAPAVIYSSRREADFAPTFVSQNIRDWLGYEPEEYLEHAASGARVHPDELAAVEAEAANLFRRAATRSSTASSRRTAAIAG